jgi:hypothetical protein
MSDAVAADFSARFEDLKIRIELQRRDDRRSPRLPRRGEAYYLALPR